MRVRGACQCRAIKFETLISPSSPWLRCHCPHCRQAHATAYSLLAPLDEPFTEWRDSLTHLRWGPDSTCLGLATNVGDIVQREFCGKCGSAVSVVIVTDSSRRVRLLAVGSVDDACFPEDFVPVVTDLSCATRASWFGSRQDLLAQHDSAEDGVFKGSCICGSCSFQTVDAPNDVQHCHCSMCRRMSGSAFQTWTPVRKSNLQWLDNGKLAKVRASSSASREFCRDCGAALTIAYDGQRGHVWLAVGCFVDGKFSLSRALRRSAHICAASAPPWNRPEKWPADGLRRITGVCEGDEGGSVDIREALRRSLSANSSSSVGGSFDGGLADALRRSLVTSDANSDADSAIVRNGDDELQRAITLSLASSMSVQVDPGRVATLVEMLGCAPAAAEAALVATEGNMDAAAAQLLAESEPSSKRQREVEHVLTIPDSDVDGDNFHVDVEAAVRDAAVDDGADEAEEGEEECEGLEEEEEHDSDVEEAVRRSLAEFD